MSTEETAGKEEGQPQPQETVTVKPNRPPPSKEAIREIKHYVDRDRRRVVEFVQVYGKQPPLYRGLATIEIRTPMGERQMDIEFPFDEHVTNVKKAFEKYDEVADAAVENYRKKQADAARIVGAKTMPNLVGADGKPIKTR